MTNFELNQEPIEPSIATTNELTNIEDKHEGWAYPTEIKSELPDAPKFNSTALFKLIFLKKDSPSAKYL